MVVNERLQMRGGRQGHEVHIPYCENQSVLPWLIVSASLCLTGGSLKKSF